MPPLEDQEQTVSPAPIETSETTTVSATEDIPYYEKAERDRFDQFQKLYNEGEETLVDEIDPEFQASIPGPNGAQVNGADPNQMTKAPEAPQQTPPSADILARYDRILEQNQRLIEQLAAGRAEQEKPAPQQTQQKSPKELRQERIETMRSEVLEEMKRQYPGEPYTEYDETTGDNVVKYRGRFDENDPSFRALIESTVRNRVLEQEMDELREQSTKSQEEIQRQRREEFERNAENYIDSTVSMLYGTGHKLTDENGQVVGNTAELLNKFFSPNELKGYVKYLRSEIADSHKQNPDVVRNFFSQKGVNTNDQNAVLAAYGELVTQEIWSRLSSNPGLAQALQSPPQAQGQGSSPAPGRDANSNSPANQQQQRPANGNFPSSLLGNPGTPPQAQTNNNNPPGAPPQATDPNALPNIQPITRADGTKRAPSPDEFMAQLPGLQ